MSSGFNEQPAASNFPQTQRAVERTRRQDLVIWRECQADRIVQIQLADLLAVTSAPNLNKASRMPVLVVFFVSPYRGQF